MRLEKRVAIVTGGSRGIGRAIAERFAREGAAVMLNSRTEARLRAATEELRRCGGRVAAVAGDVSEEEVVARLVGTTRKELGAIDILVNNAGVYGGMKRLAEMSPEEWDRVMAINLRSAFLLTRAVLPKMMERGRGAILNISSISAKSAYPLSGAYAASKAGLLGLTRTAAAEASAQGVRVNALCPGPVEGTDMWNEVGAGLQRAFNLTEQERAEETNAGILQRRPQRPEEVAAAALFLCSDDASAITGQAVNVDGGEVYY